MRPVVPGNQIGASSHDVENPILAEAKLNPDGNAIRVEAVRGHARDVAVGASFRHRLGISFRNLCDVTSQLRLAGAKWCRPGDDAGRAEVRGGPEPAKACNPHVVIAAGREGW